MSEETEVIVARCPKCYSWVYAFHTLRIDTDHVKELARLIKLGYEVRSSSFREIRLASKKCEHFD